MEKEITISSVLLKAIIKYIEETQVTIDSEWGSFRDLKDIIKDGDMPKLYNDLIAIESSLI